MRNSDLATGFHTFVDRLVVIRKNESGSVASKDCTRVSCVALSKLVQSQLPVRQYPHVVFNASCLEHYFAPSLFFRLKSIAPAQVMPLSYWIPENPKRRAGAKASCGNRYSKAMATSIASAVS